MPSPSCFYFINQGLELWLELEEETWYGWIEKEKGSAKWGNGGKNWEKELVNTKNMYEDRLP